MGAMDTRRTTRAVLVHHGSLAAAGGWLAACSAGGGTPAKSTGVLDLVHWGGLPRTHPSGEAHAGTLEAAAPELLDRFGVRVTYEVADTEKIMVAATGGTPPNTAWHGYADGARLFLTGLTVDPDEELKKVKEWAAQRKDIFPSMLESSLWRGKLTSIPIETNNRGIYYDKAILSRLNIAPPGPDWTRAEFEDRIVRATAPPDHWGFTITPGYLDFLIFYGGAGGKVFNQDATKWTVDNEIGRNTLRWLHDLVYKRQAIPAPPPGELMNRGEGKVAFDITGNFRYPTYRQRGLDVGAAPMPLEKQKFTIAHGWNVSAFKVQDADTVQRAARLIMWLTSPAFQVPYLIKSDNVPASRAEIGRAHV
jgi:multiple sugar transport system substrate-binding protein